MLSGESITRIPNLSESQKLSIVAQNELIMEIFKNQFKLKVREISRDKEGHIYVFTVENNRLNAYVCAYDTLNKCLTNYKVGRLEFKEFSTYGYVEILRTHRAFYGKGLGTLMLQAFENYLIDRNKKSIELESIKTFEDISKNHYDIDLIEKNMNEINREAYIKKYFHDVNYYFYSTLGYIKVRSDNRFVKMKKDNLRKMCMSYGLERSKLAHKEKLMPSITESMSNFESGFETAKLAHKQDYFIYNIYGTPSENIYPLPLKPIYEDFAKLYNIIKKTSITVTPEYKDELFTSPYDNNYYCSKFQDLDKLYNMVSDLNEAQISVSNLTQDEMLKLKDIYNHYVSEFETEYTSSQSTKQNNLIQNKGTTTLFYEKSEQ